MSEVYVQSETKRRRTSYIGRRREGIENKVGILKLADEQRRAGAFTVASADSLNLINMWNPQ